MFTTEKGGWIVRNRPHQPTSADVAALAGVSRSTVSRVINGYQNVPEPTRVRVLAAIEQNGYFPSVSGQMLRSKRTHCLGVFLGEDHWRAEIQAAMLYAFCQATQALGYRTLTGWIGAFGSPQNDRAVREVLYSGCVDAAVFLNARGGENFLGQLLAEGHTLGALGCSAECDGQRLYTVGFDESVTQCAMDYARSLGHRRIALLCDPMSHLDCACLCGRFQSAGAQVRVTCLAQAEGSAPAEQAAALLHGADAPTLFLCADLRSAYAAYGAAGAQGLSVGRDISVLGVGALPSDLPLWPPLTSFRFDPSEVLSSLTQRLIDGLEGATSPRHTTHSARWSPGGSCAPANP